MLINAHELFHKLHITGCGSGIANWQSQSKVRVTYSVPSYDVNVLAGGGIMAALAGSMNQAKRIDETWPLDQCAPFAPKDKHRKTSYKALVMANAYSNVIMDKIEEAIKNGVSGNETEDW